MSSSVAITQQSFIHSSSLFPTVHNVKLRVPTIPTVPCCKISSQEDHNDPDSPRNSESHLAKLAVVALAAGVLTLGSAKEASAAKSGGRVNGQGVKSPAGRSSTPGIMSVRSHLYERPTMISSGMSGGRVSFGLPCCGGWGWTPMSLSVVGPRVSGPGVGVGVRGGGGHQLSMFLLILGMVGVVIPAFFLAEDASDAGRAENM